MVWEIQFYITLRQVAWKKDSERPLQKLPEWPKAAQHFDDLHAGNSDLLNAKEIIIINQQPPVGLKNRHKRLCSLSSVKLQQLG